MLIQFTEAQLKRSIEEGKGFFECTYNFMGWLVYGDKLWRLYWTQRTLAPLQYYTKYTNYKPTATPHPYYSFHQLFLTYLNIWWLMPLFFIFLFLVSFHGVAKRTLDNRHTLFRLGFVMWTFLEVD
jgi:hypothetical protein